MGLGVKERASYVVNERVDGRCEVVESTIYIRREVSESENEPVNVFP